MKNQGTAESKAETTLLLAAASRAFDSAVFSLDIAIDQLANDGQETEDATTHKNEIIAKLEKAIKHTPSRHATYLRQGIAAVIALHTSLYAENLDLDQLDLLNPYAEA